MLDETARLYIEFALLLLALCMGFIICFAVLYMPLYSSYANFALNQSYLIDQMKSSCEIKLKSYRDNYAFIKIAENLAGEKNYSQSYNCDEFSKELKHRLEDAGYETYYIYGSYNSSSTNHAWVIVEVPIESISGQAISPEEYTKNYEERGRE